MLTPPPRAFAFAALAALTSCFVPDPGSSAGGSFHAEGGALGTWDLAPAACISGDHDEYKGVELPGLGAVPNVRLIEDPANGTEVSVLPPNSTDRVVFQRADCALFDEALELDGTTGKERSQNYKGHLSLDCESASEGHLTGDVTFASCGEQ